MGRTIAIGDIHGCSVALATLVLNLKVQPDDLVISLGDVIDRGPDSRQCIETLLFLEKQCQVRHIMGNHEEMMLDALADRELVAAWQRYGGAEFLDSYGGEISMIPESHLDFIRSGEPYIETDSTIFCHATIQSELPLEGQDKHWLRWSRISPRCKPHYSGKRVVCGHSAQPTGLPLVFPGWVCIDTCVYGETGCLTALDVDNDLIYQADEDGKYRGCYPLEDYVG